MEVNQASEKDTEAGQERQPSLEELFARLDGIRSLCMSRG